MIASSDWPVDVIGEGALQTLRSGHLSVGHFVSEVTYYSSFVFDESEIIFERRLRKWIDFML